MKIVHIHQYYNDGMGYQENILPRYQANLNNEVILITSNLSNGFNGEKRVKEIKEYIDYNFKIKRIAYKTEFKNRFVIFNNLYEYLEDIKPEYIFHHSVTAPSLATVAKYKKNNPEVFLVADNHADLNISARNKIWKILYYNIFWKNYIKRYDKYIDLYFGVTPSRCLFLNEELGVNNEKIRLLPIGVEVCETKCKLTKNDFFNKYSIDPECFIITHGGKMTKEKKIDRILKAFSRIKNDKIRLVLFGKIEDKTLYELIKKDKRIINIGWLNREDTLSLLSYSDLGIWNSQHTTLLEDCISAELPMILRYYGSTAHLIKNSGIFLYEGSIKEIQDRLELLIENNVLLKNMKKNAKNLKEILSYANIAKESIDYKNSKIQKIDEIFMSKEYCDIEYENFRLIKM